MTTTVHAYSSYLHPGSKLQIVQRVRSTGAETVIEPDVKVHVFHTHHCWDDCELVFREMPVDVQVEAPAEGLLMGETGETVPIGNKGSVA